MKKISDLVTIPEVETVIQVSSAEGMSETELKKSIVDSFIITDDIFRMLEAVLFTIRKNSGCGILLKGNYGSGKSHFLAFLSALFRYPAMLKNIGKSRPELSGLEELLDRNKILPVSITLTDFSANNSLAEIVTDKISDVIQREGAAGSVWDSGRIVADFRKMILPNIKNDFYTYTGSRGCDDFDGLNIPDQSSLIIGFLKEKDIPFRPFYDYRDIFDNIDENLKDLYPGGIFLLIDELSEFLRSRNSGDLVSEDIRFIQFLGEKVKSSRLGVVFSMQEAIEEVADVSTDGLNRIKDRYPVRINLTAVHLRELVEKRLLPKEESSLPFIDDIFLSLHDSFPGWRISKEDFRAIYPVHPAAFKMLEGITGLFSKTRGMVDFIYTEIKGDPSRHIKGILDESCDTLLYPERIFDHFRNNLEESVEYNRLLREVYSSYERDLPAVFNKPEDAALALRVIKLILLYQVMPGENKPTAAELTHLVMDARFKLDPEYNYKFIREKILRVMEKETGFLGVEKGGDPNEDRFFLLSKESPLAVFESRVRQFIAKNVNIEKQAIWFFISRLQDSELPLADYKDNDSGVSVRFENTIREGMVFLKGLENIEAEDKARIENGLNGECDFVVMLGFPVAEENVKKEFKAFHAGLNPNVPRNIFYWKPVLPDDADMKSLLDSYAKVRVYESEKGSGDAGESESLREVIKDAGERASRIIKNLYGAGSLYFIREDEVVKGDLLLTSSFEKTVELFVRDSLKELFPSHSRIMPAFEIGSMETFRQIIFLFRERGEADFNFEGSTVIRNAVDALLKNSALLKIVKSLYSISPEPSRNVFLKDLLYEIEQKAFSFPDLYRIFRKGKYGIQRDLFALYIFFLAYSGFITLEKSGKSLRPEKIDLREITSADEIKTGEGLSPLFIEKYYLLEPFTEGLNSRNIHLQTQRMIWDKLVLFKRDNEELIRQGHESVNRVERHDIFKENSLSEIRESYNRLIAFLSGIKVSKQSKDGFDDLLEAIDENINLERDLEIDKRFRGFCSGELDRVIFIYNYLTDPGIHIGGYGELKDDLSSILGLFREIEDLIIDARGSIIIDRFNEFKEKYKSAYLAAHKDVHSSSIINEFDKIKTELPYRILSGLARIETVSVKDDLVKIDSIIRSVQLSVCRRSVSSELDTKPYCQCRLRREEVAVSSEDVLNLTRSGIRQYLSAIQGSANREKINRFMSSLLSEEDEEKRRTLKDILEFDVGKVSDNTLIRTFTPEIINLINRALSGNIRIVKKRIRDFYNSIFGRRFRREDLVNIFNDWLETRGESGEELIFEIEGFEEKQESEIPAMLLDEIEKAVGIDDEKTRIQAFALAYLVYDISGNKYFNIIKDILYVDLKPGQIKRSVDIAGDLLKGGLTFDDFFRNTDKDGILGSLDFKNREPHELGIFIKRARFFTFIYEHLLELFITGEIKVTREIRSELYFDESPRSRILAAWMEIDALLKDFYKESGRLDGFNKIYFLRTFEILFQLERMQGISLNNNILIDLISDKCAALREEIRKDCEGYFYKNIESWEKDHALSIKSIPEKITTGNPVFIIIDSMRIDLFLELEVMLREVLSLKRWDMDVLITASPSDTLTYRETLFPGIELVNGTVFDLSGAGFIFISAAERDYKKEELWNLVSENNDSGIIISFSILDEKIHSSKQNIVSLSEELSLFCEQVLIPLLRNIHEGRSIVITSDHGFVEHQSYGRKDQKRFTHGGDSLYERLVPFAVYRRV